MTKTTLCVLLAGVFAAGALIGDAHRTFADADEIQDAWDNVMVVSDGQLIPNPAYYALHPEALGRAHNVEIIDIHDAAAREAGRASVNTAKGFNND